MRTEVIFGPPGTGKTTALLGLVDEEFAAGTRPERLGYLSFTKKAASEAATRACKKFGVESDALPWFRTLHSLCYRRLGLKSGDVLERAGMDEFSRRTGVRVTGRVSEDGTTFGFELGDRILHMENLARVREITLRQQYDQDSDGLPWTEVSRVSRAYEEFKKKNGLLDYTDMLSQFANSAPPPVLDVVILDEAQDQSALQWRVVAKLTRDARRAAVAGDDDQAIYTWAGAASEHMLTMDGERRVLAQSWRVPAEVQKIAARLIAPVRLRQEKTWRPREGEGIVDRVGGFLAADVEGEDVLVMARNTYVLREHVEPMLRAEGVLYERRGHLSIRRAVLDAVLAWERLRRGELVSVSAARVVYAQMTSGVGVARGHKALPEFPDDAEVGMRDLRGRGGLLREDPWYDALDRLPSGEMSYLRAALRRGEKLSRARVRVSTIHSEKGGEADHVILLTEMARRTHDEMVRRPDEERRVCYVAVTRARRRLTIVGSQSALRCPWL